METPRSPTNRTNDPAPAPDPNQTSRVPRRTPKACRRCKKRKIKCTGENPCHSCSKARHECIFEEDGRRVLVLQSELRALQEKANSLESGSVHSHKRLKQNQVDGNDNPSSHSLLSGLGTTSASPPASHCEDICTVISPPNSTLQARFQSQDGPSRVSQARDSNSLSNVSLPVIRETPDSPAPQTRAASNPTESSDVEIPNPLTTTPSRFAIDSLGSQRYLGHSSTWSFSWHVRTLLKLHVNSFQLHDEVAGIEGAAYGMSVVLEDDIKQQVSAELPPGLPPLDYVEHLLNSIEFHVGTVFYLFDKTSFLKTLTQSSQDGESPRNTSRLSHRLWRVQAGLVIALGQLIIGQQATDFGPPGAGSFIEAVQSLPNIYALCRQPIMAVEVLCLIALYLQCADMRNAAYIYIGQATSIALSKGLNRAPDLEAAPSQYQEHCVKLWWTVYILERRLSTLMGVPPSLNDDEGINVPLPDRVGCSSAKSATVFTLHVKLAQILGKAMKKVYRLDRDSKFLFLDGIQGTLSDLSDLIEELNAKTPLWSSGKFKMISRDSASLHLTYHQCAILTIRPLVFYLAQKKLEISKTSNASKEISEPIRALLQTCVESAKSSLQILSALHEQSIIAPFLPFDSECTFSSAFTIILATTVDASFVPALKYYDIAKCILHSMAQRGNMQAINYEMELEEIFGMASIVRETLILPQNHEVPSVVSMDGVDLLPVNPLIDTGPVQSALQFLDEGHLDLANLENLDDQWFWELGNISVPQFGS